MYHRALDSALRYIARRWRHSQIYRRTLDGRLSYRLLTTLFVQCASQRLSRQFNSIGFERCMQFLESRAYFGGGLSFYTAREPSESSPTNSLCFVKCTWESNIARAGSTVDLSVWHPSTRGALVRVAYECLIAAVLNATQQSTPQSW